VITGGREESGYSNTTFSVDLVEIRRIDRA
jgi:hypothetical protein